MNVIGIKTLGFIPCIPFIPVKKNFDPSFKSCHFSVNQHPIAFDFETSCLGPRTFLDFSPEDGLEDIFQILLQAPALILILQAHLLPLPYLADLRLRQLRHLR